MNPCSQLSTEAYILLHCLYIYRKELNLPSQSITEALYTNTLFIYIYIYIYIYIKGDERM